MRYLFVSLFILSCTHGLIAEDKVCQKCVRIREENAKKALDQKWTFYEDWLKDGDSEAVSDVDFEDSAVQSDHSKE